MLDLCPLTYLVGVRYCQDIRIIMIILSGILAACRLVDAVLYRLIIGFHNKNLPRYE